MSWKECDRVSERLDFVVMASASGANISTLCERFGSARKTGYKWLARYRTRGLSGLENLSKEPHGQPVHLSPEIEAKIVALKHEYPVWGARKLWNKFRERNPAAPLPAIASWGCRVQTV